MPVDLNAELDALVQQSATAPVQGAPSTPPMERKDWIQRTYNGDDGSQVTVYSNDGKRKSAELFDKAVQHYASTGKDMKGFLVLQPGVLDTLRSAYERVNQPVQQMAPQVGASIMQRLTNPAGVPIAGLLQKMGVLTPEHMQSIQDFAGGVGSTLGRAAVAPVSTPEGAGMALGTAAGAALSGGFSLAPQMALTGLGAMAGHQLGGRLGGGAPPIENTIVAGATAAAAQGFGEVLKYGLGLATKGAFSTSQLAEKQVSKGITDLVKSKYGQAGSANAQVLEMIGSNPKDVARLTNMGVDAILGDLKAATPQLRVDIMQQMPRTLTVGAQNTVRAQLRRAEDAAVQYMEDIGTKGAEQYFMDTFTNAKRGVAQAIVDDFKGMSKPALQRAVAQADAIMDGYAQSLNTYKPGATLLKALRESSAEGGFNARAFQQTLQGYQQPAGSFMEQVGEVARRGGGADAIDEARSLNLKLNRLADLPFGLGNLGVQIPGGTQYAGKVEGTMPTLDAFGSVYGNQAIRDYLSKKRDR